MNRQRSVIIVWIASQLVTLGVITGIIPVEMQEQFTKMAVDVIAAVFGLATTLYTMYLLFKNPKVNGVIHNGLGPISQGINHVIPPTMTSPTDNKVPLDTPPSYIPEQSHNYTTTTYPEGTVIRTQNVNELQDTSVNEEIV